MKITRDLVAKIAKERGYEPVQIDGIPEGFSWLAPDVTIGEVTHKGRYVSFSPLKDEEHPGGVILANSIDDLLAKYKEHNA